MSDSSLSEENSNGTLLNDDHFKCSVADLSGDKVIKCVSVEQYDIQIMTKKIKKLQKISHPQLLPIHSFSFDCKDNSKMGYLTLFYNFPVNSTNLKLIDDLDEISKSEASIVAFGVASTFQALEKTKYIHSKFDISYILINDDFEPFIILLGIIESGESLYDSFFELLKKIMNEDEFLMNFKKEMNNYVEEEVFDKIIQTIFFSSKFKTDDKNVEKYHKKYLSKDLAIKLWKGLNHDNITLNKKIDGLTDEIEKLKEQFGQFQQEDHDYKKQEYSIQELKKTVLSAVTLLNTFSFTKNELKIPLSIKNAGIFSYLINSQESVFDRLVIPSQSSGDVYCVIDKNDPGNYSSGAGIKEYIKFEFPEPIRVNGFKIQSAHRAFLRSWKLVIYDDEYDTEETIYKVKDDHSLDGVNKELIVHFNEPVTSSIFKIEKKGVNWANTKFCRIKNVEFFSDQPQFVNGVFHNLIKKAGGDPHKADVYVTASSFDFRRFHMISPSHSLCTLNDPESSWYQFELTKGKVIVQGYRLQFLSDHIINKFTLKGSNNMKTWSIIDRQNLKKDKISQIYINECSCNIPYKYIKLFNDLDPVDGERKFRLRHFDVFGIYLPE